MTSVDCRKVTVTHYKSDMLSELKVTKFYVGILGENSFTFDLELRGLHENFGRAISEVKLRPAVNHSFIVFIVCDVKFQ